MSFNADKFVRASRLHIGSEGDYITTYNRLDPTHQRGFVANLTEQARAHGHSEITREHACVVSNMIGREFDVILLCGPHGQKTDYVKGMVVLNSADTAEGRKTLVEDIVVDVAMRQRGYATTLMRYCAIEAWAAGKNGLTLEVGRQNVAGQRLYEKLGATVTAHYSKPDWNQYSDVWHVSPELVSQIADKVHENDQTAELATLENLEPMARVIATHPNRNSGPLAGILADQANIVLSRQAADRPNLTPKDKSFIVAMPDGSFAITSEAYSTFNGSMRSDSRFYLANGGDLQKAGKLLKGVCAEMASRNALGNSLNIEFCGNTAGLSEEKLMVEAAKIRAAQSSISRLGAVPLEHNGARMMPFELSGDGFLNAVTEAVNEFPDRPLTNGALQRFHNLSSRRRNSGNSLAA